jgi:chemotaxis protein CheD
MPQQKIVDVAMGHYCVAGNPTVLQTGGIGPCIAIILHDGIKKVGGLAHTLLPHAPHSHEPKKGKYSDTAIVAMLQDFTARGSDTKDITAKLVGGAHMFSALDTEGIGEQHANATLAILNKAGIQVAATLTGGSAGRTVLFDIATGQVRVTTTI